MANVPSLILETGETKIIFFNNSIIKILSYFLIDLNKMQNIYISNFKKELSEQR